MKGAIGVRKGAWTEEEDVLLKKCVEKYGEGNWHQVPCRAGLNRCRKSCRLRWLNYLKPNIKRGAFQEDEVDMIIRLHKLLGNRWSLIAGRLPGRTANDVKNYWNTHVAKKVDHHKSKEDNHPGKCATKVSVIRPRPWTFTKSSAWLKGKATLVASRAPPGSGSEGWPDANSWPWESAMEERQKGWNELSFDANIWELLGVSPPAIT
ncbi:hypothetical protein EUGRSUZ_F02842 [Eucalyptus grandis]|uniref:Uncharacterized protein n=2 Tax=Eucalyptus grandis TaxID=71139 RepID=A0ACC3KKZ1_EUCGR|nr:hypothetical protein EUGRSUZ_F02842 [Eucalyptus grandis]